MRNFLACGVVVLAACAQQPKTAVTDDFAGLDAKSDSFSSRMKIVGSLDYGQTSASTRYTKTPRYRAFKFAGNAGDLIDVWVRSTDGGDAVAWVLDNDFHVVASNDDADDTTLDSHVNVALPENASATHYVVFRDYWTDTAHFTVEVAPMHCGGFVANAVMCPDGYMCQLRTNNPDAGGSCVLAQP